MNDFNILCVLYISRYGVQNSMQAVIKSSFLHKSDRSKNGEKKEDVRRDSSFSLDYFFKKENQIKQQFPINQSENVH